MNAFLDLGTDFLLFRKSKFLKIKMFKEIVLIKVGVGLDTK